MPYKPILWPWSSRERPRCGRVECSRRCFNFSGRFFRSSGLLAWLGICCGLAAIIINGMLRSQKMKLELAQTQGVSSASEAEMMREIQRLKDRVNVLERLATDGDRKLAGEIESLRRSEERL